VTVERQPDARAVAAWWCAVGASALAMDLGHAHAGINSDGLIQVLISVQYWTPFYWGQHRFGMLVPWLARPVRGPIANLLVQGFWVTFAVLGGLVLAARYVARRESAPLAGALAGAMFFGLAPALLVRESLAQPYGPSLALGVAGLSLLEPRSDFRASVDPVFAVLLTGLAYWVNSSAFMVLMPLLVTRVAVAFLALPDRRIRALVARRPDPAVARLRTELVSALFLQAVATAASLAILPRVPGGNPYATMLPRTDWPAAWTAVAGDLWEDVRSSAWPAGLAAALVAGIVLQSSAFARDTRRSSVLACAGLSAGALVVAVMFAVNQWVWMNHLSHAGTTRYLLPALWLAQVAVTLLGDVPVAGLLRRVGVAPVAAAAVALLAMALVRFGPPLPSTARADIVAAAPAGADVLADRGVTHICGDYWRVWPLVVLTKEILHERGVSREVWGVTYRGDVAQQLWRAVPPDTAVIGAPAADAAGCIHSLARDLGLDPARAERVGPVVIVPSAGR